MVNVTHNGDDGVARYQVFGLVFFLNLVQRVDNLRAGKADFVAKLVGDKTDGLCVKALVDADEDANLHTGSDNLRYGDVHHRGQLVGGDELRHLQRLLVLHLAQLLLLNLLVNLLAFLAVVLRSLRLTHRAQSCQSLFNLLFDLGVVHLRFLLLSSFFLFLALLVLAFGLLLGGIGLLDCLRVVLVDLYALFLDAFAFLLFLIVAAFGLGLVKLGQVDFRHNFRTFELLVLGLDELDFLLWSLLRGFFVGLGLRSRGCDRLLHSFFFCGGYLLLLGFRSLGFLLLALFLFFGLAVLLLGLALFCRAHTGVDGRKVNLVHYAHLCVKGVLALFGTSHRAAQHLGLELGRCRFRLGFGLFKLRRFCFSCLASESVSVCCSCLAASLILGVLKFLIITSSPYSGVSSAFALEASMVTLLAVVISMRSAFSFTWRSAWNAVANKAYCSGVSLAFGLASTTWPFLARYSTRVGMPTFSSLAALLSLMFLGSSDITLLLLFS